MNLIRQIQLPNGRRTTNLGFGCAGLMRSPTGALRERLVRSVFDAGITHFDVARMYGDGLAEGFVGAALGPVRTQATIATKFGLPYTQESGAGVLKSLAKFVMHQTGIRDTVKKLIHPPAPARDPAEPVSAPAPNHYTTAKMEESLAASLERLQTDYIDLYFIHEPALHDSIAEDLTAALEQKKASGRVRAFGVSCGRSEAVLYLNKRPEICGEAIQHPFDVFGVGKEDEPLRHAYSGIFGLFAASLPQLKRFLAVNPGACLTWSDRLGLDLSERENIGIVILAIALTLNPQGMVLFSTSKPDRVRRTVQVLSENSMSEEHLREFRRAMTQAIHAG